MVSGHPWVLPGDRTPELPAGSFFKTALELGPGTRHVQRDCFGLLDLGCFFFLILDIKKEEEEKCLGFLFISPRLIRQLSCPVS